MPGGSQGRPDRAGMQHGVAHVGADVDPGQDDVGRRVEPPAAGHVHDVRGVALHRPGLHPWEPRQFAGMHLGPGVVVYREH